MLANYRTWKQRVVDIVVVTANIVMDWSSVIVFSSVMKKDSDISDNSCTTQPYAVYDKMLFDVPVGKKGYCYSRYLIRSGEGIRCDKVSFL